MALESASFISGLVDTNPTGTDAISQGDDHLRLIKSVLQGTFPNAYEAINGIHTGATAPTSTSAGQLWFDTSTDLVKVRNTANSDWEVVSAVANSVTLLNRQFYTGTSASTVRASTPTLTNMSVSYTKQNASSKLAVTWRCDCEVASSFGTPSPSEGNLVSLYVDAAATGVTPSGAIMMQYFDDDLAAGSHAGGTSVMRGMGSHTWEITGLAAGARTIAIYGENQYPLDGWAGYAKYEFIVEEWL